MPPLCRRWKRFNDACFRRLREQLAVRAASSNNRLLPGYFFLPAAFLAGAFLLLLALTAFFAGLVAMLLFFC
jgi:hypothetical protein